MPRHDPVGSRRHSPSCQIGCQRVFDYITAHWEGTDQRYGCYNPDSRTDSGKKSLHAEGRAIDVYVHDNQRGRVRNGQLVFKWVVANADALGVQEVIWSGQIWTALKASQGIRDYITGGKVNRAHDDHVHIGFNWDGALGLTSWFRSAHKPPTPGETMTDLHIVDCEMVPNPTPNKEGRWPFWAVGADGGVFANNGAVFHGSLGGQKLSAPIVDIEPTVSGKGYWLLGADGGVFSFGDAEYHGNGIDFTEHTGRWGSIQAHPNGHGYILCSAKLDQNNQMATFTFGG